jgi:MYXO-CTERM domain-containing protein
MMLHRLWRRAALIAIVCLVGVNASLLATASNHTPGTAQLGGWVYIDKNNDGDLAFSNEPNPEYVIPNVTISLYSQSGPETFLMSTVTDQFGRYFFDNLAPGTYGLKQTQPVEYVDGLDTLGQMLALTNSGVPGSASVGTMANNAFNNIVLPADVRGDYYLFGELGMAPGYVSKRYLLGSAPPMEFGEPDPPPVPEPTGMLGPLLAAASFVLRRRPRRGTRSFA